MGGYLIPNFLMFLAYGWRAKPLSRVQKKEKSRYNSVKRIEQMTKEEESEKYGKLHANFLIGC